MKDQNYRKRKIWLDTYFILLKRTITKNTRRKVSKENTKSNKWNRKYCENGHRKNNKPEIHFGPIISDRTKSEKGIDNQRKRRNQPKEPTLSTGPGRKVRTPGRNTP